MHFSVQEGTTRTSRTVLPTGSALITALPTPHTPVCTHGELAPHTLPKPTHAAASGTNRSYRVRTIEGCLHLLVWV